MIPVSTYIIEVMSFLTFGIVCFYALNQKQFSYLFYRFVICAVVIFFLELINETWFSEVGTYYRYSLLYFPFFKFPVAIIILGFIYFLWLDWLAKILSKKTSRLLIFIILVLSCYLVEFIAIKIGYWSYKIQTPFYSIAVVAVYFYYLLQNLPVYLFSRYWEKHQGLSK